MSTQMADKPLPSKSALGFFLTEKYPARRFQSRASLDKERQERAILENISRRMFPGGLKTPLLKDIPTVGHRTTSNFRFDIIDSKRVPRPMKEQISAELVPRKRTPNNRSQNSSKAPSVVSPRAIKFLLPDGSFRDTKNDTLEEKGPDPWERWKDSVSKAKDARDRLYRNTYCSSKEKMRYNLCTLPRIAHDRPWTVGEIIIENSRKNMVLEREKNDVLPNRMKVPQPDLKKVDPIQITSLQKQNTMDSVTGENCFEVRRIEASSEFVKENIAQLTTLVRQPSDLGRILETPKTRKLERPLKNENMKYRPVQWGTKTPIRVRKNSSQGNFDRDYKSVEAYKEYVEIMQKRGIEGKSADRRSADRESSLASQYGYENRVLQSVIDVNQPKGVVAADGRKSGNPTDRNSIVIEIKPTWDEQASRQNDVKQSEDGRTCPVNSPLLELRDETIELPVEDTADPE